MTSTHDDRGDRACELAVACGLLRHAPSASGPVCSAARMSEFTPKLYELSVCVCVSVTKRGGKKKTQPVNKIDCTNVDVNFNFFIFFKYESVNVQ